MRRIAPGSRLAGTAVVTSLVVGTGAVAQVGSPALAQAPGARCSSSQLAVRIGQGGVALGHVGQVVSFSNTSHAACTLHGYPGLQMLSAQGHPIRTQVLRGTAYTVPAVPKRTVTLRPGARASFDLGYDDATGYENDKCPTSARVEITPPNAYRSITVAWRMQPYGGGSVQHLRCGQVTVSPVFPAH